MRCAWVRLDMVGNKKIKKDEYGFWLVKLGALWEEDVELYVFPHQVSQVRPVYTLWNSMILLVCECV
jgi:hypothetical protein